MVQISADVLINYILIFFILLLFLVLTRRLSNKEVGDGYFVMLKSQNTFNLSLSFYASGMGLWIIASPAEVGWYGLGFDVIGYAISAATPFGLLYFLGPKIVDAVPDKATLPQYINKKYGNFAQIFVSLVAIIYMSAFLIAEFETFIFITSAPKRLPANSNDESVLVELSKNKLIWVLPFKRPNFLFSLRLSSTNDWLSLRI